MPLDGMPSASQVTLFTDSLAAVLKYSYANLGLLASGDTASASFYSDLARKKILGDGGSNPGLGAPTWERNVSGALNSLAAGCRWDGFFASRMQTLVSQLDSLVASYLPSGWKFPTTSTQAHLIDMHLTRLNAISAATPATPTSTPVLTAAHNALGALPSVSSGSAPRVVYTLVGALDYNESLPSGEATQVALSGSSNAYSMAVSGVIPSGITKVRVYRGVIGGATGAYQWDQDVTVSAGGTFPAITILQPDSQLRADIAPPSWMSAIITPEFAAVFALAYGSSASTSNTSGSSTPGVSLSANGMLSPANVALNPANGLLGVGNPASTAIFGTSTITGSGTQTYSPGTIQTANNSLANVQGFLGSAGGLRARVTSALTGGVCTLSFSYQYLAAATGQTVQTQSSVSFPAFSTGSLGDTVTFVPTAGRLVTGVTITSVSGAATGGTVVVEALPVRTI